MGEPSSRSNLKWQALVDETVRHIDVKEPSLTRRPDPDELASYIDHTLLKIGVTNDQIEKLCEEAKEHKFRVWILLHGCALIMSIPFTALQSSQQLSAIYCCFYHGNPCSICYVIS